MRHLLRSRQDCKWYRRSSVEFARDRFGNSLGGIRLAEHAVPTAKNTGMNSGTGNRFCFLYGSHEAFSEAQLRNLYSSREEYVQAVTSVVQENLSDGISCLTPPSGNQERADPRHRPLGRCYFENRSARALQRMLQSSRMVSFWGSSSAGSFTVSFNRVCCPRPKS